MNGRSPSDPEARTPWSLAESLDPTAQATRTADSQSPSVRGCVATTPLLLLLLLLPTAEPTPAEPRPFRPSDAAVGQ